MLVGVSFSINELSWNKFATVRCVLYSMVECVCVGESEWLLLLLQFKHSLQIRNLKALRSIKIKERKDEIAV